MNKVAHTTDGVAICIKRLIVYTVKQFFRESLFSTSALEMQLLFHSSLILRVVTAGVGKFNTHL